MMRFVLVSAIAAAAMVLAPSIASARDSAGLVMYVAPGPDYRVSLGFAESNGDQITILDRMEMSPGCAWTRVDNISIPADEVVPIRAPALVGGAERFGVLYATTYSALVSGLGGTPAVENHTCVRVTMTSFARSVGEH